MSAPFKVKAIYDYSSAHDDDLKFNTDQIITVTAQEDDDWYEGYYLDDAGSKHEGIFPRNFVEKYEPTAPPRPTRTRTKKEPEPAAAVASSAPAPAPIQAPAPVAEPEPEPASKKEDIAAASPTSPKQPVIPAEAEPSDVQAASPVAPDSPVLQSAVPEKLASPPVSVPKMPEPAPAPAPASTSAAPASKPAPGSSKPGGPPPVSQKPANSAFRDRIAAFNKAPAPPPVPKPSGFGGKDSYTIKKPFSVAPPSKDSYVPPPRAEPVQKLYRRDEDPEIKEQIATNAEIAEKASAETTTGDGEDEPRPMTVKERMALIQRQQQEQAQRAAEAAAKKDKPKRPPKKRMESHDTTAEEGEAAPQAPPLDRRDTEDTTGRRSIEESHPPRVPHPGRRKSSKDIETQDGNEADMSGAGDTEGQESELTEREEAEEKTRRTSIAPPPRPPPIDEEDKDDEDDEEEEDEEEEDDVDPEVRRKEELRARMAKMSGGMGMIGGLGGMNMMGMPMPGAGSTQPKKKKPAGPERRLSEQAEDSAAPTPRAPPVPTMVPIPGMSRPEDKTPIQEARPTFPEPRSSEEREADEMSPPPRTPSLPVRSSGEAPPVPGGRPAPPPVPTEGRAPPPPPPTGEAVHPPTEGSESDDELSEQTPQERSQPPLTSRPPPPPPVAVPASAAPTSPQSPPARRRSQFGEEASPASPTSPQSKRVSRLPPPIPGAAAPALPPAQTRAPPPPPPGGLSRQSTADGGPPPVPKTLPHRDDDDDEVTEYEGDYDTDIASSVPHKDALKSHARESSMEDAAPLRSPVSEAPPTMPPPIPSAARAPPPIPTQPPPDTRPSAEMPRAAPPPPPAPKEAPKTPRFDDDYDPYNYTAASPSQGVPIPGFAPPPPAPKVENMYSPPDLSLNYPGSPQTRPPPPAPPSASNRNRQSLDVGRPSGVGRRSTDITRPSMESGFVANELDLAPHSAWYVSKNNLPPQLQGRKDIFFESEESQSSANGKPQVTRDIWILYTDYSQTIITVTFDPTAPTPPASLSQRHEPPPRALRQDQLETAYERFGRPLAEAVATKKDSVVGDGTPHALVHELLRPHKDALLPVGTRAFGALVYSNLANASTTLNDEIRPGDIMSVRNARFQGKHGPMHAKYSVEVGKPDHVAIVAEWDGTKKKVRAWEQGRENRKVKLESFKLDDLRSGEVKIWRVMERGWVGWEGVN